MVNVSNEVNGCVDETTIINVVSPSVKNGDCSIKDDNEDCTEDSGEAVLTGEVDGESSRSGASPVGSESWQCPYNQSEEMQKIEMMLNNGTSSMSILKAIHPSILLREPPGGWSEEQIMNIIAEVLDQPPRRVKLPEYNTFEDAIQLFRTRKRILILTGAGVSVSCGIPDFRSKDGIYARLHEDFPDLPDPTAMFDIRYFKHNPAPFYDFAKEIFPGQFEPSISHKFIRELEKNEQLLRNYTQNIDTLENQTGIERVIECHGSFSKATCQDCNSKFNGDIIKDDVMAKRVAHCPNCRRGIIKPDIVFFGEDLGEGFHRQMTLDKDNVDLLVVIGSSMKVRPVALIPFSVDANVPQILINREPLASYTADIELLGNCDDVIRDICLALGGQFENMLQTHDDRMSTINPTIGPTNKPSTDDADRVNFSRKRRALVDNAEFSKIMDQCANRDKSEVKDAAAVVQAEEEEPAPKRLRLGETDNARLVAVESHLPEHSYFQLNPNRAVFPGAEVHYDVELKILRRPVSNMRRPSRSSLSSSSDDEESMDPFDVFNGSGRGGSVPPDMNKTIEKMIHGTPEPDSRSASCEPGLDMDERINPYELRRALEYDDDSDYS